MQSQLTRSITNKKLAGVAGGLAEAFGWDVTLIRLGFVALTLLHGGGLLLYVLLWLLMPTVGERSMLHQTVAGAQHVTLTLLTTDRNRTLGIALLGAGVLLLAGYLHLTGPVIALTLLGVGWYLLRQR